MTDDQQPFQTAQLDGFLRGLAGDARRTITDAAQDAARGAQGQLQGGTRSMTQPEMLQVEQKLSRLGFNPGTVDGVRGSGADSDRFEAALRQFANTAKTDPRTANIPSVRAVNPESILQNFLERQTNPNNTGVNFDANLVPALDAYAQATRTPARSQPSPRR